MELDQFKEGGGRLDTARPYNRRCRNATDVHSSCEKVLHSCSPEEAKNFGSQVPFSLQWDDITHDKVTKLWKHVYEKKLIQKRMMFLGDSLSYQTLSALKLMLHRMGIDCYGESCPNGLTMDRPMMLQVDLATALHQVNTSDVVIMNTGLHYGTIPCSDGNKICEDLKKSLPFIVEYAERRNTKLIWMDTFRPHFPSKGGDYESFKVSQFRPHICGALQTNEKDENWVLAKEANDLIQKYPSVIRFKTVDLTHDRYDMHLAMLTWYNDSSKLDCVHYCLQPCFWDAILFRLGDLLNSHL